MSDRQTPQDAGARELGEAIKKLREMRGWSQRELARRAGVNRMTVMRAEGGEVATTPAAITRMASALGVEPLHLLEKAGLAESGRNGVRESRLRYIISRAEEALDWLPEEFGDRMLDQLGDVLEAYRAFAMYLRRDSSEEEAERRDAPGETDRIDSLILRELRQLRQESEAEYQARVDALRSLIAEHESRINQQDAPGER